MTAFGAALWYTLRVTVPPRRWALLLVPVGAAVLFGLLARLVAAGESDAGDALATVTEGLFGLVLPFVCLVLGDAVVGAEVRSGALALTWLSPLPFPALVLARWLGGWLLACAVLLPAMALAAAAAGVPGGAAPLALSAATAAGAYVAMFVVIGVLTRRAALWSLGVVLLGERLLGTVLAGVAQVSPQWLARGAYGGLGPDAGELVRSGVPSGSSALGRLALLAVVFLAVAVWRVRDLRLAPTAD